MPQVTLVLQIQTCLAVTLSMCLKNKVMTLMTDRALLLEQLREHVNLLQHWFTMQTVQSTSNVSTSKLRLETTQKTIQSLFQITQLSKATVCVVVLSVLLMLTKTCFVYVMHVTLVNLLSVMV